MLDPMHRSFKVHIIDSPPTPPLLKEFSMMVLQMKSHSMLPQLLKVYILC